VPYIIDIDDMKSRIVGYDPNKADLVQRQSALLADAEYDEALKSQPFDHVILLCGGSASGKSEFCSTALSSRDAIVFDSTLSSTLALKNKWERAKKSHKTLEIIYIMPESIAKSYVTFLNRVRKFPTEHFVRTHAQSRVVVIEALQRPRYANVEITIFISSVKSDNTMIYRQIFENGSRLEKLEFFERERLSRQMIENIIRDI